MHNKGHAHKTRIHNRRHARITVCDVIDISYLIKTTRIFTTSINNLFTTGQAITMM